jgi:hypothetical protein
MCQRCANLGTSHLCERISIQNPSEPRCKKIANQRGRRPSFRSLLEQSNDAPAPMITTSSATARDYPQITEQSRGRVASRTPGRFPQPVRTAGRRLPVPVARSCSWKPDAPGQRGAPTNLSVGKDQRQLSPSALCTTARDHQTDALRWYKGLARAVLPRRRSGAGRSSRIMRRCCSPLLRIPTYGCGKSRRLPISRSGMRTAS